MRPFGLPEMRKPASVTRAGLELMDVDLRGLAVDQARACCFARLPLPFRYCAARAGAARYPIWAGPLRALTKALPSGVAINLAASLGSSKACPNLSWIILFD